MAIIRRSDLRPSRATFDPFQIMREMLQFTPELPRLVTEEPLQFVPRFEVKETKDAFEFRADLPGVKEEDLEISITGNRLTVNGKREAETREESDTYYAVERAYGSFTRSFTLPPEADIEHVDASLVNGVLTIRIPKKQEAQARKIEVRAGEKAGGAGKAKA